MAGSELLRLVEVMDRLRSPGGCPWDAEQTHQSLIKYLLEESYEFIDAIETDDRAGMREELGDVLLQVYFHSRISQDHPTDPFTIDDVAGAISDKLISRHPHVFENLEVSGTDEIIENWEAIKAREKGRTSAFMESRCRNQHFLLLPRFFIAQKNTTLHSISMHTKAIAQRLKNLSGMHSHQ